MIIVTVKATIMKVLVPTVLTNLIIKITVTFYIPLNMKVMYH